MYFDATVVEKGGVKNEDYYHMKCKGGYFMLLYYCAMHCWNRTHILLHHISNIERRFVVVYFVYYEKFTYSTKVCCVLLYVQEFIL